MKCAQELVERTGAEGVREKRLIIGDILIEGYISSKELSTTSTEVTIEVNKRTIMLCYV